MSHAPLSSCPLHDKGLKVQIQPFNLHVTTFVHRCLTCDMVSKQLFAILAVNVGLNQTSNTLKQGILKTCYLVIIRGCVQYR